MHAHTRAQAHAHARARMHSCSRECRRASTQIIRRRTCIATHTLVNSSACTSTRTKTRFQKVHDARKATPENANVSTIPTKPKPHSQKCHEQAESNGWP
eukprot:62110-Pleurochrysis_carterae.AAC.1